MFVIAYVVKPGEYVYETENDGFSKSQALAIKYSRANDACERAADVIEKNKFIGCNIHRPQ